MELGPGILKTIFSISFKKPSFSNSAKLPLPSILTSISIGSSSMKNLLPGACCPYNIKIVTTVNITKTMNFAGDRIIFVKAFAYNPVMPSISVGSPFSRTAAFSKVFDFLIPKLPNLDPIAGVKTRAYNIDPTKTINNVTIIGLKNCPDMPGIKNIGTNIDRVVPTEIVTGQNILFAENL